MRMRNNHKTLFEEQARSMTQQIFFLQDRLERTPRGSPEHEALLRNLAAVSVLRAASESLLDAARARTFVEDPD